MTLVTPLRWTGSLMRESALLALVLLFHIGIAALFLALSATTIENIQTPQIQLSEIEVELTTVEADPTQSPPPSEAVTGTPLPTPETDLPAFLSDPFGDLALPSHQALPTPPLPTQTRELPTPEIPLTESEIPEVAIPEIALPPAKINHNSSAQGGATARIEHPTLAVDLASIMKTYPKEALRRGHEGVVILTLTIDANNAVTDIRLTQSSGSSILDKAAIKMLRTAPFVGGPGELSQPIRFSIKR